MILIDKTNTRTIHLGENINYTCIAKGDAGHEQVALSINKEI